MKKHAADWPLDAPTPDQLKELFAQIASKRITRARLQDLLTPKKADNKAEALVPVPLKHDKTKDGWKLLERVEFYGQPFDFNLVEFLKPGESYVNGEEMKQRAIKLNAHLGQGHAEYLEANQDRIPKEFRGKYYLVFPGTVWQGSDGDRGVPCLYWFGDRWFLSFFWLGGGWYLNCRLVCLRHR